ncbi:MAG: patatin-like phospholipase family protein [Deltaproteobacteria bacterium]|nr:patatin-like phospholipase family protein [Deltaproteobacteria bacterium]
MTADSAPRRPRIGFVLAGGGARGAYEVGVLRYILEELPRELGRDVPVDVVCGTSVGAINACYLAAYAEQPRLRAQLLVNSWRGLRVEQIVRVRPRELLGLVRQAMGGGAEPGEVAGGVIDPGGLSKVLTDAIPFERIDDHVASGRITGVGVSTTHVGSGRTVVFVQHARYDALRWGSHPTMERRPARIRVEHALASAAIPFVFPGVRIDGETYCDGGLRQNVPLSPARRLGADRLVVINPHFLPTMHGDEPLEKEHEWSFANPVYLLGKTLNALLLDRLDSDVDRLNRINEILAAGTREYGPGFIDALNRQLGIRAGDVGLRPLETVVIRSSENIGKRCAAFVRAPAFDRRVKGLTGAALRRMGGSGAASEADLLSYLLFDGEFASELIALGEADARAQREPLLQLFEDAVR